MSGNLLCVRQVLKMCPPPVTSLYFCIKSLREMENLPLVIFLQICSLYECCGCWKCAYGDDKTQSFGVKTHHFGVSMDTFAVKHLA